MDLAELFNAIKKSFCGLISYKARPGNVLEIITAFTTLNSKFVSVFLKYENGRFIVTDGGWIQSNYYENPIHEESEEIIKRIVMSFQLSYDIKITQDKTGLIYYYKVCNEASQVASCVFDLANFIVGTINAHCLHFKDEREERERDTFRKDANGFLKTNYGDNVKLSQALDDLKSIRFNAIVNKRSQLYLITYITGSTPYYFDNDLRKTIVNFELTERSKYNNIIQEKISIINNRSEGYQPDRVGSMMDLLREKSTRPPINWTDKERLLELV